MMKPLTFKQKLRKNWLWLHTPGGWMLIVGAGLFSTGMIAFLSLSRGLDHFIIKNGAISICILIAGYILYLRWIAHPELYQEFKNLEEQEREYERQKYLDRH